MSINEKTLVFIILLKNACSFYLNEKIHLEFKNVILDKCNKINTPGFFLKGFNKQIQKKIISYANKVKEML